MSAHALTIAALAAVFSIVLAECAVRLPFPDPLARAQRTLARALQVVAAKSASERSKETLMLACAGAMLAASLQLAAMLLALVAAAGILVLAFSRVSQGFGGFIVSWWGVALTLLFATFYLTLRRVVAHGRL